MGNQATDNTLTPERKRTFFSVLDTILNVSTVLLLVNILVMMSLQITMRYVFNYPLTWTEEISKYSLVWMTFLGSIIVVREKEHILVDFLLSKFPSRIYKISKIAITILGMLFLGIIVYYGILFVGMNLQNKSLVTGLVKGYVYAVIPFSAFFMIVYHIKILMEAK